MARLAHPILPDDLRTGLERIGDALRSGLLRPLPHAEIEAAARLAAMPAAAVPMAGGMVAQALAPPYGESPPIRPAILARLLGRTDDAAIPVATPALQCLLLFHPDGRRREAALGKLETVSDSPFLVAAIFHRLNDWAGPVRAAARGCALRLLPATNPRDCAGAGGLAAAYAELAALAGEPGRARRRHGDGAGHGRPRGKPARGASRPDGAAAAPRLRLAGARPASDRPRRPRAFQPFAWWRCALIEGRAVWPVGYERVWVDKVYGISRRVVRLAERPLDRPLPVDALIRLGLGDRSAAPRRIAAEGLILHRRSLGDITPLVERLAGDKNPSVRERAAFLAARLAEP